ncbi:MAG: hypothetical protein ACR2PA_11155 [Hyphomicrobiaceae bacterium]
MRNTHNIEGQVTDRVLPDPSRDTGQARITSDAVSEVLHLAELVPIVRQRLAIEPEFPDDAILASLKTIALRSNDRERMTIAFACNLGHYLGRSDDPVMALRTLVALLPPPRS